MVCSDGLTSMVREPKLEPLLVGSDRPLDDLGRELIAAANAAGGRDNITVSCSALEEVDAPRRRRRQPTPGARHHRRRHDEYETFSGEAVADPRQGVSRPRAARAAMEAMPWRRQRSDEEAEYRASGTVALSAVRPRAQPIEEEEAARASAGPAPRKRRRRLFTPGRVLALGCLIGLIAAFWLATRQVYFVGVDESRGNVVTALPRPAVRPPARHRALSPVRHSGVTIQSRAAAARATFTDHKLRSKDDAESLVRALEQGDLQ